MQAQHKQATLTHTTIQGVQIPVIYERSGLIPSGVVRLVFEGGGSFQDGKLIGRSALTEELLNRGSKTSENLGFASKLENRAIALNVSSGTHTLSFTLSFLHDDTDTALALLDELLASPNLTATELTKAKTAIIARILANQNDYDELADELLDSILFKGTPLAQSKLGTKESINAITLQDIQNALDSALMLKRLIIVIGGDIDLDSTLRKLQPTLSRLKAGQAYKKPTLHANSTPTTAVKTAPTEQAYIYFGAPFTLNDMEKESYLAKVAGFILGAGGFGSRLLEEVRVKHGLAYSAYIRFITSSTLSYTSGYLQTKLESQDKAIAVVKQVVADFIANGATQAELDAAKQFLLGSEPLGSETLSQRLERAFSEYYSGVGIGFSKQNLARIKALDLTTLNAYIKSHTEVNNLSFAIITAPATTPKKASK